MKLNNMKIGVRFLLGFSLLIGVMIIIIAVSISQMADSRDKLEFIVKVANTRIKLANTMIDNARETAINVRNIVMSKESKQSNDYIKRMRDELEENRKAYKQNFAKVKTRIVDEDTVGLSLIDKVEASGETAFKLQDKVVETALAGKTHEAFDMIFGVAYPSVRQWIKDNNDFIKHNEDRTTFRYNEAIQAQKSARILMFILGSAAIAMAISIAILMTLSITRPLNISVQTANNIAGKNLAAATSPYAKRGDEVGVLI